MFVEEIMVKDVITIERTTLIRTALELLEKHRIRHIPVIDENRYVVGIVADRDIRDASPSIFQPGDDKKELDQPVSTIMTSPVITIMSYDLMADAAVVLYDNDISALPVVSSDDKLVGILTETNVLHTLVKMTGANQPSSQIDIVVPNLSGQLAELSLIFKEKGTNVISVLLFPHKEIDKQVLSFRVQTMDPRRLIAAIEEKGYTVQWPRTPEPGS